MVLKAEQTNNKAWIFTVGLTDGRSVAVIAKTQAQRRIEAEQGELISIHIDGISKSGNRYGLINPTPVRSKSIPAAPNSFDDLAHMFAEAA